MMMCQKLLYLLFSTGSRKNIFWGGHRWDSWILWSHNLTIEKPDAFFFGLGYFFSFIRFKVFLGLDYNVDSGKFPSAHTRGKIIRLFFYYRLKENERIQINGKRNRTDYNTTTRRNARLGGSITESCPDFGPSKKEVEKCDFAGRRKRFKKESK